MGIFYNSLFVTIAFYAILIISCLLLVSFSIGFLIKGQKEIKKLKVIVKDDVKITIFDEYLKKIDSSKYVFKLNDRDLHKFKWFIIDEISKHDI
jgi:uncharacterized membrane protein